MTLWHDQTSRRERSHALDDGDRATTQTEQQAQPGSRRAARERERRAAEALAAGQQHPSGVVDLGDDDPRPDFEAEAGIAASATTTDIWTALSRTAEQPPAVPTDRRAARRAAEAAEQQAREQSEPIPEGLMERVRERVLQDHAVVEPPKPLTRRQLRQRQSAETVDGMPASWFSEAVRPAVAEPALTTPESEIPDAFSGREEIPTVQMSGVDRAMLEARTPMTAPVDLPQFFSDPVGDDELAFSDPILPEVAQPLSQHPAAEDVLPFLPPAAPSVPTWTPRAAEPAAAARTEPAVARAEPDTDTGATDLAGFEALINRSRGSLAPDTGSVPQPEWRQADEGLDPHAGFQGLLSRNVATPNGSQNALIMPSDPQPDLTTAVTGTGEQFITGSMKLPRSLAATGGTAAHYDSLEVDRLFESQDEPAAGVTPVRAVRAVSGGASTHDVRPRRNRSSALPVVLAVVAGVMAIGVITLLVGSWVLNLF